MGAIEIEKPRKGAIYVALASVTWETNEKIQSRFAGANRQFRRLI